MPSRTHKKIDQQIQWLGKIHGCGPWKIVEGFEDPVMFSQLKKNPSGLEITAEKEKGGNGGDL